MLVRRDFHSYICRAIPKLLPNVGIRGLSDRPLIKRGNGQGDIIGVRTYLCSSLSVVSLLLF